MMTRTCPGYVHVQARRGKVVASLRPYDPATARNTQGRPVLKYERIRHATNWKQKTDDAKQISWGTRGGDTCQTQGTRGGGAEVEDSGGPGADEHGAAAPRTRAAEVRGPRSNEVLERRRVAARAQERSGGPQA